MTLSANVLDSIGSTALVQLQKVVPPNSARVVVKLEGGNPTGNMKDRMAKFAIEAAERDGRLKPGGTVVEYTGGSTGASLALVCAAKGYRCKIVTSDAFSEEKTRTAQAFGAEVTLIASEGGKITEQLIRKMMEAAKEISQQPGHWWFDQLNNKDAAPGYYGMARGDLAASERQSRCVCAVGWICAFAQWCRESSARAQSRAPGRGCRAG